jgi:hypothetical protein
MGYHTEFEGAFNLDKPLDDAHKAYLNKFAQTRRMMRSEEKVAELPDPIREAANLPVGKEGGYFVGGTGFMGQNNDTSVYDHNSPPTGQPGLWCQWVSNEDGTAIEWDGGEKFYEYVLWIKYIIANFLKPWGYTLNGVVSWRGEDFNDVGDIVVTNNVVTTKSWRS